MSRRLFELAVRARRYVGRTGNSPRAPEGARPTARRQLGNELTQFSFRLAFMIDIAYVSIGALGGAAVGRASAPSAPPAAFPPACNLNSPSRESDLSLGIMKIPRLAAPFVARAPQGRRDDTNPLSFRAVARNPHRPDRAIRFPVPCSLFPTYLLH
jgi:hypothetical protein